MGEDFKSRDLGRMDEAEGCEQRLFDAGAAGSESPRLTLAVVFEEDYVYRQNLCRSGGGGTWNDAELPRPSGATVGRRRAAHGAFTLACFALRLFHLGAAEFGFE